MHAQQALPRRRQVPKQLIEAGDIPEFKYLEEGDDPLMGVFSLWVNPRLQNLGPSDWRKS